MTLQCVSWTVEETVSPLGERGHLDLKGREKSGPKGGRWMDGRNSSNERFTRRPGVFQGRSITEVRGGDMTSWGRHTEEKELKDVYSKTKP